MDFSKHIQKAEEALRRRNFDFAAELYRQLVDLDPDLGEARAGLRRACQKRAEKKGKNWLRSVGGAMPLTRAKALFKLGKFGAASRALEDYLAKAPTDVDGNLLLGQSLEGAGWDRSARAVYEYLAEIAPDDAEGLRRAGALARRCGDAPKALEYFERALAVDPRDREALKARKDLAAETALSAARYDEVGHSREVMRRPEGAKAEGDRSWQRSEEQLRQELEQLEQDCLEGEPEPQPWIRRAEICEHLGDLDQALEMVERGLEYRIDSPSLLTRAVEMRLKLLKRQVARAGKDGNEAEAENLERQLREVELEDCRRRVELSPGDASLRLQLGRRLLRAGELDPAVAELQRAQSDPRVGAEALFLLGRCFQEKGIHDLARSKFEQALEGIGTINDRAKEILYSLAAISEAEGNSAAARSFYIRIYEVDIGYRDVAAKMETLKGF